MPLSTFIVRLTDKLILVETLLEHSDSETKSSYETFRKQAKDLFKKMSHNSEPSGIIISEPNYFLYVIEQNILYMTLCEKAYPKRLAYNFLEEIKKEFDIQFGGEVMRAGLRPYAFQKFDTFIQKTKALYRDTKAQKNLDRVSKDLKDVNRIMTQNIKDILTRDGKLEAVADRSSLLLNQAQRYKDRTTKMNSLYYWRTYGPILAGAVIILLFLVLRFYWF
eukprot:TRINITY_DN907_c0_g1_i1.p1 TRINITY_DN907_c0_g1~~TRINITY_DN907_c0_g1_i1.p1  ORF type:complete len:253 (-),score=42.30 TRINITY_DN907_c0_g1_i1:63-725(-)